MTSRVAEAYQQRFEEIVTMKHDLQAAFYLNAFWNKGAQEEAENIWQYSQSFKKIDEKGADGNSLDEFMSHRFLETLGETLTVLELRAKLKEIDVDMNKRMSVVEYCLFKYGNSVEALVDAPQGDNSEAIEDAQKKVASAQAALQEVQTKLAEQEAALAEQQKSEAAAKAAEEENKAALAELQKQEEEYNGKIATLEEKSKTGGVVTRNKAVAELEVLKAEDPLPLRRAKINQEAAVRKSEKAAKAAEEARLASEAAKAQVEEAVAAADASFKEALDFLEEVKASSGTAEGSIWFMERDLEEAKKYMPQKKRNKA